jgi:hypothetical protein
LIVWQYIIIDRRGREAGGRRSGAKELNLSFPEFIGIEDILKSIKESKKYLDSKQLDEIVERNAIYIFIYHLYY